MNRGQPQTHPWYLNYIFLRSAYVDNNKLIRKWSDLYGLPVVTGGKKVGTVEDFYLEPGTNAIRSLRINTGVYAIDYSRQAQLAQLSRKQSPSQMNRCWPKRKPMAVYPPCYQANVSSPTKS